MRRLSDERCGDDSWLLWVLIWLALPFAAAAETAPDATGGYLDDAVCGTCHADLAASYRSVGMSRAFGDAAQVDEIELFSTPDAPEAGRFFHALSGRWYDMRRSSPQSRPVFRRWFEDATGREMDVFEAKVDWTLGSGHTSRSYLLHQPGGELFVLPIAWYTQKNRWAMSPGFDQSRHMGLRRRVQRECMFCHNGFPPRIEAQPDRFGDPHLFPTNLPHGTGCQRCHGPGAKHVEAAYLGGLDDAVRSQIVNPSRLSPKLRDDVCEQCHLQPSVALMPTRRFGRRVYDYRPGEDLDDYLVYYDPEELDRERGDRFEINHHPYRMRQSACFLESGSTDAAERLSCLTCHDPHRKVPEPERAAHYRQACQSCHQVDACGLRAMTESKDMLPLHMRGVDPGNCVGCHMPRRRTRDVIHVVMTDHKIQTLPGSAEPDTDLTAPREEFTPTLVDMDFYLPETAPEGDLGQVYQAYGVELIGGNTSSFEHLQRMVASTGTQAEEPRIQLTRAYLIRGLTSYAERTLEGLLEDDPDDTRSLTLQALAKSLRDPKAALTYLERARAVSPFEDPDLYYNLGVIYGHADRPDDALAALERTVELRPLHSAGWMQLGLLQERLGQLEDAERALRRSLATEPTASRARLALARVLMASDQRDEAIRQLRHGWRWGDDPEDLAQALEELGAELEEPVSKIKSTDGPARGTDRRDNRPAQRPGAGSH